MDPFWSACTIEPSIAHAGYELRKIGLDNLSPTALDALAQAIPDHYFESSSFRSSLDGEDLARSLEARLPKRGAKLQAKRDRAGDLGEILGLEWLRKHLGASWEVCLTLRWKESSRPRRGEDIVALRWDVTPVGLLKGEAKSAEKIGSQVVKEARIRLDQDNGWPAPFTVDFISEKLEKNGRINDAKRLYIERFKASPSAKTKGCTHFLFLLTSKDPCHTIEKHGAVASAHNHHQMAAVLVCPQYNELRDKTHNRAIELTRRKPAVV